LLIYLRLKNDLLRWLEPLVFARNIAAVKKMLEVHMHTNKPFLAIAVIVLSLISGCASSFQTVWPKLVIEKTYKIGQEATSTTGSSFIRIGTVALRQAYRPRYDWQPPNSLGGIVSYPQIKVTQIWFVQGIRHGNIVTVSSPTWKPIMYGKVPAMMPWLLDINPDGTVPQEVDVYDSYNVKYPLKWELPDRKLFDRIPDVPEEIRESYDAFKAELIYNGISKNTIKISYREFVRDMARPAFYQELNYDLDQSNIIQFKSLTIKIINADNSSIKFIVLEDAELPWFPKTF
jgi:hypothetical protein